MKTHLLDSSVPLTEGQDQIAICGENVKGAAFAFMWDGTFVGGDGTSIAEAIGSAIGMCRKCVKSDKELEGRYIYGICAGEELKQRRVGEEA